MGLVVSLPMRDGNGVGRERSVMGGAVVSLPMRDGNWEEFLTHEARIMVVSLPMRDGNTRNRKNQSRNSYGC